MKNIKLYFVVFKNIIDWNSIFILLPLNNIMWFLVFYVSLNEELFHVFYHIILTDLIVLLSILFITSIRLLIKKL